MSQVVFYTFLQSLLSSGSVCVLSLIAAPGYAQISLKYPSLKKTIQAFLLFPQIVSPIFIVLCLLLAIPHYPYGLWGVILGHVFINTGLGTVILGEKWLSLEKEWKALATFWGSGVVTYVRKVMLPLLRPQIMFLFALVFGFSITSLIVPLTFGGGGRAYSLEAMIFEKIKAEANVSSAAGLSLIQLAIQIIVFFIFIRYLKPSKYRSKISYVPTKHVSVFAIVTFLFTLLLALPFLNLFFIGVSALKTLSAEVSAVFWPALLNSFIIAAASSVITLAFIIVMSLNGLKSWFPKIPAPSSVVLGVVLILLMANLGIQSQWTKMALIIAAHVVTLLFVVLRLIADPLHELHQKYIPAMAVYGIPLGQRFFKIYWPLAGKYFLTALCVAFCWSLGEFSIASLVGPVGGTLPVFIFQLLGQYRLELAALFSLVFLIIGLAITHIAALWGRDVFYGEA